MADPRLPTLTKQPWEDRLYDFDFRPAGETTPLIPEGRSIASVTGVEALASTPGGKSDLGISAVTDDGDAIVQARIADGSDGEDYPIRVRVIDDVGNKIEGDAIMRVREL